MIKIKTDPPERYKWSPEDQGFLDNIWGNLKTQGYNQTASRLDNIKRNIVLQYNTPGVLGDEDRARAKEALSHIGTLRNALIQEEDIRSNSNTLPEDWGGETVRLQDKMVDWYGPDAEKMSNLPGMRPIAAQPIPVRVSENVPDYVEGQFDQTTGAVELSPSARTRDKQDYVTAHELGHATMWLNGSASAANEFYDWDSVRRNTDLSKVPGLSRNVADAVLGKHTQGTPAEFAAYLLEYVRANNGAHPALHPNGIEAGLDALTERLVNSPQGQSAYKVSGEVIRQNPRLREDLLRFFSKYAEGPKVTSANNRYEIA